MFLKHAMNFFLHICLFNFIFLIFKDDIADEFRYISIYCEANYYLTVFDALQHLFIMITHYTFKIYKSGQCA